MGFILFLLILIIILTVVLMLPLKFIVFANFDSRGKYINIYFLKMLKINVALDGPVYLSIYLFKNRIYRTRLKKKKETTNSLLWVKSAVIENKKADIYYGMRNPFSTGVASGALGVAAGFLKLDEMNMHPDFFSTEDYLRAEGSAEIIVGNTISNYVKNKRKKKWRNNEWSKA